MIYNATVYISSNSEHTVVLYGPAWRDLMLRWVDSAPPPLLFTLMTDWDLVLYKVTADGEHVLPEASLSQRDE